MWLENFSSIFAWKRDTFKSQWNANLMITCRLCENPRRSNQTYSEMPPKPFKICSCIGRKIKKTRTRKTGPGRRDQEGGPRKKGQGRKDQEERTRKRDQEEGTRKNEPERRVQEGGTRKKGLWRRDQVGGTRKEVKGRRDQEEGERNEGPGRRDPVGGIRKEVKGRRDQEEGIRNKGPGRDQGGDAPSTYPPLAQKKQFMIGFMLSAMNIRGMELELFQLKREILETIPFQSDSKWMKQQVIFSVVFLGLALLETTIFLILSF